MFVPALEYVSHIIGDLIALKPTADHSKTSEARKCVGARHAMSTRKVIVVLILVECYCETKLGSLTDMFD